MPIPDSIRKLQMKFQYRTEAEIAGVKFGLQVLSLNEEQRVQSTPSENMEGMAFYSEMQKAMLSYAIRQVDDEELPDVVEEEGPDGKPRSKERPVYVRELLDTLPNKVTDTLFDVYVDLREQKEEEINNSLSYSWYKTPEQREVEREARVKAISSGATESPGQGLTGAHGATGVADVPSPDADIALERLPSDHSDADDKPKT